MWEDIGLRRRAEKRGEGKGRGREGEKDTEVDEPRTCWLGSSRKTEWYAGIIAIDSSFALFYAVFFVPVFEYSAPQARP